MAADLQLFAATICWTCATRVSPEGLTREVTAVVVLLSGGALFANVVSVGLLVIETVSFRPR